MPGEGAARQLEMLWPRRLLGSPPRVGLPAAYELRAYREGDGDGHVRVMRAAGFEDWSQERLRSALAKVLPGGLFLAVARPSGRPAATAMATHNPSELHPSGGELGWVAADPAHAGRGLGRAVCAAVVRRFLEAGYRRIYLKTDDFRLAAVKVYLRLGWAPFLCAPGMEERWRAVCAKLEWPFTPGDWPRPGRGGQRPGRA